MYHASRFQRVPILSRSELAFKRVAATALDRNGDFGDTPADLQSGACRAMNPTEPSALIPVTLLTGFLGSGKTTVLNHVLKQPEMAATAVIVNEFGEIGIDHLLVEKASDDVVLLNSGCLCCTVRGDIVDTLLNLFVGRAGGKIPHFTRVVIETTGLADPAPILHTLISDPLVAARYTLDGVVTTVDAVNGAGTLDRQPEAVKQAAVADRLLLTKTDLADPGAAAALKARLAALNPTAPLLSPAQGAVDPALLFNLGFYDPQSKSVDVQRWLRDEAFDAGHAGTDDEHDGARPARRQPPRRPYPRLLHHPRAADLLGRAVDLARRAGDDARRRSVAAQSHRGAERPPRRAGRRARRAAPVPPAGAACRNGRATTTAPVWCSSPAICRKRRSNRPLPPSRKPSSSRDNRAAVSRAGIGLR